MLPVMTAPAAVACVLQLGRAPVSVQLACTLVRSSVTMHLVDALCIAALLRLHTQCRCIGFGRLTSIVLMTLHHTDSAS